MPFSVKQTNRTVLINRIDCFRPPLDPLPIGKARGHPFMIHLHAARQKDILFVMVWTYVYTSKI